MTFHDDEDVIQVYVSKQPGGSFVIANYLDGYDRNYVLENAGSKTP